MRFNIKAVIFDMDGVITDTMPYHCKAWKTIFTKEGIKISRQDVYCREGQKGIDSVRELCAEHNHPFTVSRARQLLKDKEEFFKSIFKRRFIAGARSFVRRSYRQGFKLALVTGTSRHEAMRLLPADLFGLFHVTVCGCDVQNGKPHPESYLKALSQLGLKPKDVLVIENAPFGIRSAKAAGLRCLALETSLPRRFLKNADAVFSSFNDLSGRVTLVRRSVI